ncbi:MAG: hypothetical protein ACRDRI_26000 [Pseudonocardiaceae bacterium]
MYLDRAFRDTVIRKVHNDPRHRVAPSYGFDLIPVVEHAWRAWSLETSQQSCIFSVLALGLLANTPATIMAASGLGLWQVAPLMLRTAPKVLWLKAKAIKTEWFRRRGSSAEAAHLREQTRLLGASTGGCVLLIVVPLMTDHFTHTQLTEAALAAALFLLVIAVVSAIAGATRQLAMNHIHRAKSLRPETLTPRQQVIDAQQSHTYVVYPRPTPTDDTEGKKALGLQTPFLGSGERVYKWRLPLSLQLLRPGTESMAQREYSMPPFRAHELVNHLKIVMAPVGDAADPLRLPGFQVRDRLYIAETDVPSEREFLREEPSPADITKVINDPHGTTRHYLEICVTDTGELVTTVFLRVTVKGRSLSLNFAAYALNRTPEAYHVLDKHKESGTGAVLRSTLRGLRDLPDDVSRLWRLIGVPVIFARAAWSRKDRSCVPRRRITLGTRLSVREEKSAEWNEWKIDEIVIYNHIKIVEQRLIKATEDFLKLMNVDTSVFKKQAFNVINNMGVIGGSGKLEINQPAIGPNAQVHYDYTEEGGATDEAATAGGDRL